MAKFCDKCGYELKNENVKFCDNCGAELPVNNDQSNSTVNMSGGSVICSHCGQSTPIGQPVCANCGSSLEENTLTDWIIVIIGYILAILINGIGLIYGLVLYFAKGDNEFYRIHSIIITAIAAVITLAAIVWVMVG